MHIAQARVHLAGNRVPLQNLLIQQIACKLPEMYRVLSSDCSLSSFHLVPLDQCFKQWFIFSFLMNRYLRRT